MPIAPRRWRRRRRASSRASAAHASRRRRWLRRSRRRPAIRAARAMTPVLLMRHGPTDWNERAACRAAPIPGCRPRPRARSRLALPAALAQARLLSSPLRRARETAALLTGRPPTIEPRLIEMDWGAWEGRALAELRAQAPGAWRRNEAPRPGFPAARRREPARGRRPPASAARRAGGRAGAGRRGLHKGVIRAALALATGWDMRASRRSAWRAPCAGAAGQPDGRLELGRRRRSRADLSDAGPVLGPAAARQRPPEARRDPCPGDGRAGLRGHSRAAACRRPGCAGGVEVVQLPAVRASDSSFASWSTRTAGRSTTRSGRSAATAAALLASCAPRVLITEMFPFGRRAFRLELLPLLEAAARDAAAALAAVLGARHPGAKAGARELRLDARSGARPLRSHPGAHRSAADPVRPDLSVRRGARDRLVDTGYVDRAAWPQAARGRQGEVLVSAGGGRVGASCWRRRSRRAR